MQATKALTRVTKKSIRNLRVWHNLCKFQIWGFRLWMLINFQAILWNSSLFVADDI